MKKKIAILFILLILVSGCTRKVTITDQQNNTKKSYTSNIICKPTSDELLKVYEENKDKTGIDIKKLPECKEFSVIKTGYESLWTTFFVKPLAWIVLKLGILVGNYGISIMVIGLLLRISTYPFTKKSALMSENMKKAKPDLDKIEKKYQGKVDTESNNKKMNEMMLVYKKYDINPLSGCLGSFLQLPFFFAFLEAVNRVPVFFEEKFLVYNLGTTPWEGISAGNYYYIIIIILIIAATYFSFKNMNTVSVDPAQAKQMAFMNKFMIVFISVASFGLPTAIALYWVVSNGFTVFQNLLLKKNNTSGGKKWKSTSTKAKVKKA